MKAIVNEMLQSMVKHDPTTLPLASLYTATENSHAAALPMMTAWRTITKAGKPSLLAIDTEAETAYFALDVTEGKNAHGQRSILWGFIKAVNQKIKYLDLYINRSRGDHGFSYSSSELKANYKIVMNPPADRTKASRETLDELGESQWDTSSDFTPSVSSDCVFTEMGWSVIDPGDDGTGSTNPLGCVWPAQRPTDSKASNVVIDTKLGIVVSMGTVKGKVFPYPYYEDGKITKMISAFIPNQMTDAQEAQVEWYKAYLKESDAQPMPAPVASTGMTLRVDQYYNDELMADQIQVNLAAAGATNIWQSKSIAAE
ncbi:MAG: hypothetical protein QM638_05715 [Nocardioides sp.]|uniref:hypothetical protein n=1 Tax=Nocardioides sp. TaxID=35761 RepID=UPI0039E27914